ncbi:unnamed protein product [Adineta ricciae]|uniref:Uncharacterized protein n=1 Tax=Adineta ricciae TaxID=249248 RepID=A0A816EIB7_ADIRI|nr:unnamed protein product [Adineta ricciae]
MPFLYRLSSQHSLSIKKLRHALQLVVTKHTSLRTSLIFDTEKSLLMQRIIDYSGSDNQLFAFIENTINTDEQLNDIIQEEERNPQFFDLTYGLVFRCHIIHYEQISLNDRLSEKDVLVFNFHHALFDFQSMNIFLHDLNQAYTTGQLSNDDNNTLRYLDYSVIEQQMPMTDASMFWLDTLHDCNLNQFLSLPFDRYRLSNEYRTDRRITFSFNFDLDLSYQLVTYSSSNNMSLQHMILATYYAFLFKLTNGERDLCIGMNINNRYKAELKSMIGLFENIIPLRCQLDPYWSFNQLIEHIYDIEINALKYSYYPLERILDQHPNVENPAFFNIFFGFQLNENDNNKNEVMIGDARLHLISNSLNRNRVEMMNKMDFSVLVEYDLNINQFSCTINASLDLFNIETVDKIGQRFHFMLNQLFHVKDNQLEKSVYELSLILSDERIVLESINNTKIIFPSVSCIHHEFVCQVMKYPQKLAVELDDQSLTYSELLYYIQVLSLDILHKYYIVPGEIICQCVDRSLLTVIGIMAIEMVGGVYCSLSARDPERRLHTLIEEIQSRLVLVHHLTKTMFNADTISLDIDSVLINNVVNGNIDIDRLSNTGIIVRTIAYVTFTSGSTGKPKVVPVHLEGFINYFYSLINIDALNKNDIVLQLAASTFDIHILEILASLFSGATVIMLHPDGNMDFAYLDYVLRSKEVTHLMAVPTFLKYLCDFILEKNLSPLKSIRNVSYGGEYH